MMVKKFPMRKLLFKYLIIILCITSKSIAQIPSNVAAEISISATASGDVPFWMRSNQFGSTPLKGGSTSLIGKFVRDYSELNLSDSGYYRHRLFDWGFGIEGRTNINTKDFENQLIQAYAKTRISIFELKLGRFNEYLGLGSDPTLSSGSFTISGNALSVPKIEIAIPDYFRIPVLGGIFSFKGNFAHGWIGHTNIADTLGRDRFGNNYVFSENNQPYTYLHQKTFYGRFGRENWKLQLYGGINHLAFWGSEKAIYGSDKFTLTNAESLLYVATGKAYGGRGSGTERSKIGNQIGSIDIGGDYDFGNIILSFYRQNFFDVGAIASLANLRDGLNGIAVQNKIEDKLADGFNWKRIVFEFLYTRNQAGENWSKRTKSGDENYYNNYLYKNGWSYNGVGLGTPFIGTRTYIRKSLPSIGPDYFINNRVYAFHTGIQATFNKWLYLGKLSYSRNLGTFGTSTTGHSLGEDFYPYKEEPFREVGQLSGYFEANKSLAKNYYIGYSGAFDIGNLLNNSFGLQLRFSKRF
jgi:hypothetical protein